MANRTSYAPQGMLAAIPEDELISTSPNNPVSPQIITETISVIVTRPGPNVKKNTVS